MTMRITVKNEDTSRTAVVKQLEGPEFSPTLAGTSEIKPGESAEFWIYVGRKLDVSEKVE